MNFTEIVNHSPLTPEEVTRISSQVQGLSDAEGRLVVQMSCRALPERKIVAEILRRRKPQHRA